MFETSINKEEIAKLPKLSYHGKIHVISKEDELTRWLPALLKEHIIGFDTETKPSFKKGQVNSIAILQFATPEVALLIQLKQVGLPQMLLDLLENPQILKIGAATHDDIKGLKKISKFTPNGFVDLQSIVSEYGIESLSVRKLAAIVLGYKVSKSQQLSNWESTELSEAQQQYAAIDAWVCREIYLKLITSKIK